VSVDFEKIPACVFDLFKEIMWANPENRTRPKTLTPMQRTHAYSMAWGWKPPLMNLGTKHLTSYGLAAYAWHEEQLPPAVWLGDSKVRIGNQTIVLDYQIGKLLEVLVERDGAAKQDELATATKFAPEEIPKLMRKLKQKLPGLVTTPGKKGQGGYSTTVQPRAE